MNDDPDVRLCAAASESTREAAELERSASPETASGRRQSQVQRASRLTAKVGPRMLAQLDQIALATQKSRAQLVREAVTWFCDQVLNDVALPETLVLDFPVPSTSPGPRPRWQEAASFGLDEASTEALISVARKYRVSKGSVVREALGCWLAERLLNARLPFPTPADIKPISRSRDDLPPYEPWMPSWDGEEETRSRNDRNDRNERRTLELITTGSHKSIGPDDTKRA